MKKSIKTKVLAVIASMAMVFSLFVLPIGVNAAGNEASINGKEYPTLQEAINASNEGDTIVLLKEVDAGEGIVFNKENPNLVLDLNGFTISSNTLDVLKIKASNLNLTIKNGNLEGNGKETYVIYAYDTFDGLDLTLDNVNITSYDQAIGTNGNNTNQNITIRNSKITTTLTSIYFPPKSGTLAIDNSLVSSHNQALVLKGGNAIITGERTVLEATGPAGTQDFPYQGDPTKPDTFPKTGNAIYVEGGYNRPIALKVEGGLIKSKNNQAILAQKFAHPEKMLDIKITGGHFSTDVSHYFDKNDGFISSNVNGQFIVHTHDKLDMINQIEPSCALNGKMEHYECRICHKMYRDSKGLVEVTRDDLIINATNKHIAKATLTKNPSVDANGEVTYKCATCNKVLKVEKISKLAKSSDELVKEALDIVLNAYNGKELTNVVLSDEKNKDLLLKDDQAIALVPSVNALKETDVNQLEVKAINDYLVKNKNLGKVAQYYDVNMLLKANDQVLGKVTSLQQPTELSIQLPKELLKDGRVFNILRVYKGVVEPLTTVEKDGVLTFKTDKLSTYAIVYMDKTVQDTSKVPTDDNHNTMIYMTMGALALVAGAIVVLNKKREELMK